jgi:GAF domain-containing protein
VDYEDDKSALWPLAAKLASSVAQSVDEKVICACAETVFAEAIGHQLFTVLAYNEQAGEVVRMYSNRPSEYPVSGTKAMGPTPWGEHVLRRGKFFLGRNADDIKWAFPDHVTIAGMGLESALNLPVRVAGVTLGTVNLLHVAGHYHHAQVEIGSILAALLAPVLLART